MNAPPIITFHLHNATSSMPVGAHHIEIAAMLTGRAEGEDLLACKILSEAALRKLDGLKVSSVSNLTEAMLEVSRVRMLEAEKALEHRETTMRGELEQLKQSMSFLQAEAVQKDQVIAALQEDSRAYRELMSAMDALQHQPTVR